MSKSIRVIFCFSHTAHSAGIRRITFLRTCSCSNYCFTPCMISFFCRTRFNMTRVIFADALFGTFFLTSCSFDYCPVAPIMSQFIRVIFCFAHTAHSAGICRITLFRTCRCCDLFAPLMTERVGKIIFTACITLCAAVRSKSVFFARRGSHHGLPTVKMNFYRGTNAPLFGINHVGIIDVTGIVYAVHGSRTAADGTKKPT